MASPQLPIHDMAARHPGLTPALAAAYHEAGRVCLDRHHVSPVHFDLDDNGTPSTAAVNWEPADARNRAAFANDIDATELGGYLFALAATELKMGLVALSRAETRTGADYYVAPLGTALEDLESAVRLEASGLDAGNMSRVRGRLKEKLDQAAKGKGDLPAVAVVVGFKAKIIMMKEVGPP